MKFRIRKAVFPVAGLGTRFLPATKTVPKEMLPIIDRPLIQYAVDEAVEAGCDTMVFVTNRYKHSIADYFDKAYELEQKLEKAGKGELLSLIRDVLPPKVRAVFDRQTASLRELKCEERVIPISASGARLLVQDFPDGAVHELTAESCEIADRRVKCVYTGADLTCELEWRIENHMLRTGGRLLNRTGRDRAVVLTYELWRSAYGANPNLVGQSVEVNSVRRQVIGVMPPAFDVVDTRSEIFIPLIIDPANRQNRGNHYLFLAGRLKMPLAVLVAVDNGDRPIGFVELFIRTYAEDCLLEPRQAVEKAHAEWEAARHTVAQQEEPAERVKARAFAERLERDYRRRLQALRMEEEKRYAQKDRTLAQLAQQAKVVEKRALIASAYFWLS